MRFFHALSQIAHLLNGNKVAQCAAPPHSSTGTRTPMNPFVRTALESDAPAIARLTAQLGYQALGESIRARIQKIVAHSEHLLIVAQSGEVVCGWLQAHCAEVIESGARVEILGL